MQVHARIAVQVGFGDAKLDSVRRIHRDREEGQPVRPPRRYGVMFIGVLERVVELAFKGLNMLANVRDPERPVLRQAEPGRLGSHLHRFGRYEAVGRPVIIDPEYDIISLSFQSQFVVHVLQDPALMERGLAVVLYTPAYNLGEGGFPTVYRPVREGHGQFGRCQQECPPPGHAICHPVPCRDVNHNLPVR